MNIKKIAKKILGRRELRFAEENYGDATGALKDFIEENREILIEKNHLPKREDGAMYHEPIAKMEPAYNFYCSEIFKRNPDVKAVFEYDNFHSGTPMDYRPFPGAIREVKKALRRKNLYWYPRSSGGFYSQQKIVDYLEREGFATAAANLENGERYGGLGVNNICFAYSTTHAYSLILKTLLRPNDVVLMSAPNYGLFAIMAELDNYHTEVVKLREEDGWQVNPKILAKRIDEINRKLAEGSPRGKNPPRVAAFLNLNPHNPTGKVMNRKNQEILAGIGEVCKERGVFVIDDLVYRDLTWDQDDLALPLASMREYFDNTISLFGLSKAYGLASFRAAVIVAPVAVAEVLGQEIHDSVDSMSVLQVAAVAGTFNGSARRYREFRRYMKPLIAEYKFRYALISALVDGTRSVKDEKLRRKVTRVIKKYAGNEAELLFRGCRGLKIRAGTEPESGFFTVFDFTELLGKRTPEGVVIRGENELLEFFFKRGGLTYLMGGNIFWPNERELVGRISFGISRKAIVENMLLVNKAIRELK